MLQTELIAPTVKLAHLRQFDVATPDSDSQRLMSIARWALSLVFCLQYVCISYNVIQYIYIFMLTIYLSVLLSFLFSMIITYCLIMYCSNDKCIYVETCLSKRDVYRDVWHSLNVYVSIEVDANLYTLYVGDHSDMYMRVIVLQKERGTEWPHIYVLCILYNDVYKYMCILSYVWDKRRDVNV
jgi:hypothetical protein